MTRQQAIALCLSLCVLCAPLASARLAIAGHCPHPERSESTTQSMPPCHATASADHHPAAHDVHVDADGAVADACALTLHGCCLGFAVALPAQNLGVAATPGTARIGFLASLAPSERVEAIFKPPAQT